MENTIRKLTEEEKRKGFKFWRDFHKRRKYQWNSKTKEEQEAVRKNNRFITGYERI